MPLSESALFRMLRDLVADELGRIGDRPDAAAWSLGTALDGPAVGADSLDLTTLATAVNERFRLHEAGNEDFLLRYRTLGDWVGLAREALWEGTSGLGFRTSGTTGAPKLVTHTWGALDAELDALATLFPEVSRVVALAPAHHIYGFLYTVALPERWAVPVVDGDAAWATVHSDLQPGDLIVTIPERWRYLAGTRTAFPAGVSGVSSTAPLDPQVYRGLLDRGLARLTEVYGATETGGVGFRTAPEAVFSLLGHWQRGADDRLEPAANWLQRDAIAPMDRLRWIGERQFRPEARHDGAVQVGGTNVHPETVAETLRRHAWIRDAEVRPASTPGGTRLQAIIVLAGDAPEADAAEAELRRWIEASFPAPQRPRSLTFAAQLPDADPASLPTG